MCWGTDRYLKIHCIVKCRFSQYFRMFNITVTGGFYTLEYVLDGTEYYSS
jgi:hypothetical protein